MSGTYDSTPGSLGSYLDSPLSSPGNTLHHPGIGGDHRQARARARFPKSRMDTAPAHKNRKKPRSGGGEPPTMLSSVVVATTSTSASKTSPTSSHRTDSMTTKSRNNSPLPVLYLLSWVPQASAHPTPTTPPPPSSPALAVDAPQSTVGNITIGLPVEDREKGPNKGDILNGAVSWTRDPDVGVEPKVSPRRRTNQLHHQSRRAVALPDHRRREADAQRGAGCD